MKIVIVGGTGLIGSQLVKLLKGLGHDVLAASPNTGVNTITKEGLADALRGAKIVVDVANSPSFEDKAVMEFFTVSGKNLLEAEKIAGVEHHVALSIVGIDREGANPYFLAKLAQEKLIKASGIPYSILRATQFFEFVGGIASSGMVGNDVHVSSAKFQPVASIDVVEALAGLVSQPAKNETVEIAGPEKIGLDEIVIKYLTLKADQRKVVTDDDAHYFGAPVTSDTLTPGNSPIVGKYSYDSWIAVDGNLK
ncbi:SDR family oxidoreductase [Pedobacter miscanthi]|uniref:NmrA family transcriptional regulator n=1 Tax=Pedobacter miscanthi TaxID=2259170 RepID=A0A366KYT4_9SPHI|nr:SDR family oxidoreductase [Pedobacter miscanthi]RBQ06748.1 NmrA family transcriptional regulator [Pedobacter miscanthi]